MDSGRIEPESPQVLAAELKVELESAALKKELRTRDLVFTQILYIVGLSWIGYAGKLGSSHATFWVLALLLFYVPSCIVVIHLNRQMPLEGGLYQWAKLRFSEMAGFMVAWNIWLFAILFLSSAGLRIADMTAYALGPPGAWIANNKWVIAGITVALIGGLMLVAMYGLGIGKWIHNLGGFGLMVLLAAMLFFAVPHWIRGDTKMAPVALAIPAVSLFSLNILGKMCFGALSGFDSVGIFAGECRDPVRSIGRSVWIAAPMIGAIFILGTGSVLTFSRPEQIDLIAPISQIVSLGAASAGTGGPLVAATLVLIIATLLAQLSLVFSACIRLPMVAGWDHLLPQWFSRLHPRRRTPTGSILFIGAMTVVLGLATNLGSGNQEANQLLDNAGGIAYALAYLAMFAIPLVRPGERPSWGVRLATLAGFLTTLLYVALSIFPVIEVNNRLLFTVKIVGFVVGANVVAAGLYWRAERRRAAERGVVIQ